MECFLRTCLWQEMDIKVVPFPNKILACRRAVSTTIFKTLKKVLSTVPWASPCAQAPVLIVVTLDKRNLKKYWLKNCLDVTPLTASPVTQCTYEQGRDLPWTGGRLQMYNPSCGAARHFLHWGWKAGCSWRWIKLKRIVLGSCLIAGTNGCWFDLINETWSASQESPAWRFLSCRVSPQCASVAHL